MLPSPLPDNCASRDWLLSAATDELCASARQLRDRGAPRNQTYSPKVFIPLTQLCRDYCHYCTFSRPHDRGQAAYLRPDEVLAIARAGQRAGCTEALFTLGDKPELRHRHAAAELEALGYPTTIAYLEAMCALVLREMGLLPHVNAGIMTREEMLGLRRVSASQGLMLESVSDRLMQPGGAHYRSPDKAPGVRIEAIRLAGELRVPFTTGILIGIGESAEERLDALFAIAGLHREHGHIQEVIVQNFRAKARTPMAAHAEPVFDDLLRTIAAARHILGPGMNIQAPPNLSHDRFPELMDAGINDWGGVSPVTLDHVNPEAPWPDRDRLRAGTASRQRVLVPRLPIYPVYARDVVTWLDPEVAAAVLAASDAEGYARDDAWHAGDAGVAPKIHPPAEGLRVSARITDALDAVGSGAFSPDDVLALFEARDVDAEAVCAAADRKRIQICGDTVTYAVNRNINYTNICLYKCGFCAFSKGSTHEHLRGSPYDLDLDEVARRVREAAERGATEVCLQGGIHPRYTGDTYLALCRAVKQAAPSIHVHAFSPLEIWHGATTLGLSLEAFLTELKAAGLGTLPGTAAEILDDEVRAVICPDKLGTDQWIEVIETAHRVGLRTTSTIMFGHVERPEHWVRHLLRLRALQSRTGGITEFVPLPFVHMEAPIALKGRARHGPTFREVRLMHAVARLVLAPAIPNIQTSWTKLGTRGAAACLEGGANDLGGTLMNESIARAAGSAHGQELPPEAMHRLIRSLDRTPQQRTTLYAAVPPERQALSFGAAPLLPIVQTPVRRRTLPETQSA
jgi:FO synthase